MKLLLSFVLLTISHMLFAQDCQRPNKLADKHYYKSCYCEKYKNPAWVSYYVYKPQSNVSRAGFNFYVDPAFPDIKTSTKADYPGTGFKGVTSGKGFDKGHMSPANDNEATIEQLSASFSYLNSSLQWYGLNRGMWKSLEMRVTKQSMTDSLFVLNQVLVSDTSKQTPTGAYVPYAYIKTVVNLRTLKYVKYQMANRTLGVGLLDKSKPLVGGNLEDYIVETGTIDKNDKTWKTKLLHP